MGMIANLIRVSEGELNDYLANSSLLKDKLDELYADTDDDILNDIDKSWEGIFYLLTGGSIAENFEHPMAAVLFSDQLIDPEQDLGYGPANYLLPSQVKDLKDKLFQITTLHLRDAYNPNRMNQEGVYPEDWGVDGFDYLNEYFEVVKSVFSKAAANNQAIITFIS